MIGIGFSLQPKYDLPMQQIIPLLKNAGFSAVSPLWSEELDMEALSACVRAHGMTIQSLHALYKDIERLWEPDSSQGSDALERTLSCIDACAQFHVPVMVIHGWQGLIYTFPEEPLDFRCFDRMVEHAKKQGVSIAFENLEGEEYLIALLERYRMEPHVGYCWDSGHDHCYPHKTDFLEAFGERLIMTHLNDNLGLRDPGGVPSGIDDLHFLPYDGNIDWNLAIRKLKKAKKQTILNFELKIRSFSTDPGDLIYTQLPLEQFIAAAGKRAHQIAALYEK